MKYRRCGILQATLSLSFMYSYSFCSKYFTLINNLSMFTVSSFLSKSKKVLYSMFIILLVFKFNKYIGRIEFAKFVPSKTAKYIHTQPTNLKNCSLKSSLFLKGYFSFIVTIYFVIVLSVFPLFLLPMFSYNCFTLSFVFVFHLTLVKLSLISF